MTIIAEQDCLAVFEVNSKLVFSSKKIQVVK